MGRIAFRLLVLLPLIGGTASAHEDVLIQIERITLQMRQEPARAVLYFRRGELHRMHQDWTEARQDLERAVELDPALSAAVLALGRLGNQCGDARYAKKYLDRFLAAEPDHGEALMERGRANAQLGDAAQAVDDFNRGLEHLETVRPENFIERADVLRSQRRQEEALRGLEEGVRRLGPALPLQLVLVDLEIEMARIDAALARLDAIARTSERQDLWLVRRGEILRQAGRRGEAHRAFASAIASIEALPDARRRTKFTRDLESTARAGLEATNEKS